MPADLDPYDRKIIAILQQHGRITVTALAERIGLSKTPCQQRLKRLERDGVILGYGARVDSHKLGQGHVAFVQVTLSDTRAASLRAFNEAVHRIPEIEQCHMIAGGYDYLLKVRSADIGDYKTVFSHRLAALPHVEHTSTFVAMESVKEASG
ncbi:Lrp/AsnC family transcriptional regulator [Gammaproteobacteria bacterium]|nr:Lrp/AsnC family transcriptional regulator [Gammaproteobacteria bacterium]